LPLPTIPSGNVFSSLPTGYDVDNSCRFNDGDSAYMTRAFDATQTSTSTFTISVWVKRGALGTRQSIFAAYDGSSEAGDDLEFETDDTLSYNGSGSSSSKVNTTSAKFRDPSAWYHIVVARNSGATGASNQVKIYVNGVLQTLGTNGGCDTSQFLRNGLNSRIGVNQGATQYYVDMYMAEFVAIDGQMLDHTSFGEFDEDSPTIWKPKDVSGLTFGTNGFYLDFEDSGDLGDDESGNTNDFTETNLAAADQATDTPTNNFCTGNPLANYHAGGTYSEGNCKWVSGGTAGGNTLYNISTVGVTAGKWYCEVKMKQSNTSMIGITDKEQPDSSEAMTQSNYAAAYKSNDGKYIVNAGSATTYGDSYTTDDIVGIYIDLDNNKLYFGKNGTVQNSGTGITITGISAMTSPAAGSQGCYFIGGTKDNGGSTFEYNFGGCSAFTVSSANSDANGYGNFEYDPSSGTFDSASKDFLAICTKNLGSDGG